MDSAEFTSVVSPVSVPPSMRLLPPPQAASAAVMSDKISYHIDDTLSLEDIGPYIIQPGLRFGICAGGDS